MPYQDEDVLQASLLELLHHLWEVPKSQRVKCEDPALVCIVQIIPLYILEMEREAKKTLENHKK